MVVRVVPKQPYHLVTILVVPLLFPTAPLPPQGDRRRLRALQERAKEAKPTKANEEKRPQKTSVKRRETRNTAKAAADKEASGLSSPKRDTSDPSHHRSQRRVRKNHNRHSSPEDNVALLGGIIAAAEKANAEIAAEEKANAKQSAGLAFQDIPTHGPRKVPVSALHLGMLPLTTTNNALQFFNLPPPRYSKLVFFSLR